MASIGVGDVAPDFAFTRKDGTPTTLKQVLEHKAVVLFFYPKDHSAGCTVEACSFRDSYEDFKEAGAEVIGVSGDSDESHESFRAKHRLPFELVSDKGAALRKSYGVARSLFGLVDGRVTYVIGRDGKVRHVFESQVLATKHISEALSSLRAIER